MKIRSRDFKMTYTILERVNQILVKGSTIQRENTIKNHKNVQNDVGHIVSK